jgi:hypothetical protein
VSNNLVLMVANSADPVDELVAGRLAGLSPRYLRQVQVAIRRLLALGEDLRDLEQRIAEKTAELEADPERPSLFAPEQAWHRREAERRRLLDVDLELDRLAGTMERYELALMGGGRHDN